MPRFTFRRISKDCYFRVAYQFNEICMFRGVFAKKIRHPDIIKRSIILCSRDAALSDKPARVRNGMSVSNQKNLRVSKSFFFPVEERGKKKQRPRSILKAIFSRFLYGLLTRRVIESQFNTVQGCCSQERSRMKNPKVRSDHKRFQWKSCRVSCRGGTKARTVLRTV